VTHFLNSHQEDINCPEDVANSDLKIMQEYYFSLIASHGIYFIPGHIGAISTTHSEKDVNHYIESTARFAEEIASIRRSNS
jgi:glutamate-1-semialdehyde aminotransferase